MKRWLERWSRVTGRQANVRREAESKMERDLMVTKKTEGMKQ